MSEKIILDHFLELSSKYTELSLSRNDKEGYIVKGVLAFSAEFGENIIDDDYEIALEIPLGLGLLFNTFFWTA